MCTWAMGSLTNNPEGTLLVWGERAEGGYNIAQTGRMAG